MKPLRWQQKVMLIGLFSWLGEPRAKAAEAAAVAIPEHRPAQAHELSGRPAAGATLIIRLQERPVAVKAAGPVLVRPRPLLRSAGFSAAPAPRAGAVNTAAIDGTTIRTSSAPHANTALRP